METRHEHPKHAKSVITFYSRRLKRTMMREARARRRVVPHVHEPIFRGAAEIKDKGGNVIRRMFHAFAYCKHCGQAMSHLPQPKTV